MPNALIEQSVATTWRRDIAHSRRLAQMQNHYFRIVEHYTTLAKVVELGAPTYVQFADPTR